ncbi:MAG TPA: hypothetical protein VGQ19_21095 [Burkholderiales bacterium]|jgi:hypothetical protein|nr:hypothetical protein [Burkholderiales bacterium]
MLYDKRWDIKADPFSLTSLIAWLERQPAGGAYNYVCNGHCLLAQYLKACGFQGVYLTSRQATAKGKTIDIPLTFDQIAVEKPHTYGAALERARADGDGHGNSAPDQGSPRLRR